MSLFNDFNRFAFSLDLTWEASEFPWEEYETGSVTSSKCTLVKFNLLALPSSKILECFDMDELFLSPKTLVLLYFWCESKAPYRYLEKLFWGNSLVNSFNWSHPLASICSMYWSLCRLLQLMDWELCSPSKSPVRHFEYLPEKIEGKFSQNCAWKQENSKMYRFLLKKNLQSVIEKCHLSRDFLKRRDQSESSVSWN